MIQAGIRGCVFQRCEAKVLWAGEHNGDFGLLHKMSFLDPSVRIPLVVRTPETAKAGGTGGAVVSSPAELMDVGPTLVEVAGGQLRHEQFGRSVMPVRSRLDVFVQR